MFEHINHSPMALILALVCGTSAMLVSSTTRAEPVYPLDHIERTIAARGPVRCPKVARVRYRGAIIRYHSSVLVNRHFRQRLERFEAVVQQVAVEIYGRAPRRIRHIGTYNCRRIAAWPTYLSEHGLANAIDVAGFDFRAVPRRLRANTPRSLRRAFRVRVLKHWTPSRQSDAIHSRFLRTLARRLAARKDIFRVLLGPGYPGHSNHFHFDCGPWRMVEFQPR